MGDVNEVDRRWHARMEDALAVFRQWENDEPQGGSFGPVARIKVDEKKCFGMIEWRAVREAAAQLLPKRTASGMETSPDLACAAGRVEPIPVTETTNMVMSMAPSSAAWRKVLQRRRLGRKLQSNRRRTISPGNGSTKPKRVQITGPSTTLGIGEPIPFAPEARLTSQAYDHRHEVQERGGLADIWFLDDGDIMCHPVLVAPFLKAFDGS